ETTEWNGPLLLGSSRVMEAVRTQIAIAARTDAKVLVLGETGGGRDVVARLIHAQSTRQTRPFVAVNCSGVPETLLESELFGHIKGSFRGARGDHRDIVRHTH